ncbi:MAG TPA: serine/threonine-protein kinase [Vicinamibacterales bacterium]|nr:serine/threonine-protein kinase [Vicinamibacterales bacterium]
MLPAGTVLDNRYEILEPLGQGGMGAVFRARRRLLGDEVAIKIVRSDLGGDPAARERFMRESRAAAQLRHPNIVSILDFNLDPHGRPFLVMELLNGRSLHDEIGVRGALPIDEVRAIVGPLCGALQLAHDHGILHRDLKPANIVAHDFGGGVRVHKLVDFGLVRDVASDATRLTGSQNFVGTFMYAAPEQLRGTEADARADQYSLAVVVYELLTGRPPIEESDSAKLVTAVLTKPAPPPTSRREGLPKWVDVVLGRALAKAPADRYPSIAAFGQALQSAGSQGDTTVVMSGVVPVAPSGGGLLGTYDLGERLGPARLGSEVFRGTHRALGHPVAIRLLRRSGERNWEAIRARFLREARTLQIIHPSVIQVRDYGEEGDLVYLVTDFIEGPSLRQLLAAEGPMPWDRLRPLLEQLTEATHALHRKGGLLCGVSPDIIRVARDEDGERILISTAGIWQASDLLATLADETLRGTALADVELHYIAPEFLTGETAGTRSDVFTMGVLAYEMATGRAPYEGQTMQALLGAMLKGRPRDPGELQPTLPEAASAAIVNALSPDPGERYASARALAAAMLA